MMAEPVDGSDLPPSPRRGSLLRTVRAVVWSFFGVRKSRDLERDVAELKPAQVVLVGVAVAAVFVVALVLLVNWVIASGVAK
jgi:preprotein translocase subunit Sec61beta